MVAVFVSLEDPAGTAALGRDRGAAAIGLGRPGGGYASGCQNWSGEVIASATMTSGGSGAPPTDPMKACSSGLAVNFW